MANYNFDPNNQEDIDLANKAADIQSMQRTPAQLGNDLLAQGSLAAATRQQYMGDKITNSMDPGQQAGPEDPTRADDSIALFQKLKSPQQIDIPVASDDDSDEEDDASPTGKGGKSSGKAPIASNKAVKDAQDQASLTPQLGYGDELDDSALKGAMAQRDSNQLLGLLSKAGAQFGTAAARATNPANTQISDQIVANAGQPIQDVLTRRKGMDEELQRQKNLFDLATEKQKNDPNSPVSKLGQAIASHIAGKLGMNVDPTGMPISTLEHIFGPLEKYAGIVDANQARREKAAELALQRERLDFDKKSENQKKATTDLRNHLETFRGNQAVQQAAKNVLAAQNALSMLPSDPKRYNDLDTRQLQVFMDEIGKIASGGVPTEHGIQAMLPNTLYSKIAQKWSQLGNKPTPAQAGAFVQQNKQYLDELMGNANQTLGHFRYNTMQGYKDRVPEYVMDDVKNDYPEINQYLKTRNAQQGQDSGRSPQAQSPSPTQGQYSADVISYAQKHNITPDQALAIKKQRLGQ